MTDNKKKSLILSTLVLFLGVAVVCIYSFMPTKDIKVLETYKVNFDSAGGSGIVAIEIKEGQVVTRPENPTREGYEFVGWMLGDELYNFEEAISGDLNLRAEWKKIEPDSVYYTVKFDTDGGSSVPSQSIIEGGIVNKPSNPVKDGYDFIGWYVGDEEYSFNEPVKSDLEIYAIWEERVVDPDPDPDPNPNPNPNPDPDPKPKEYTVKFVGNGGTLGKTGCSAQKLKEGEKAKDSCTATRSGYDFGGWTTTSSGKTKYNFDSEVKKNITLYAIWIAKPVNKYTITLNANKGAFGSASTKVEKDIAEGTSFDKFTKPTRKYYTFKEWNSSADGSGFKLTKVTVNTTAYAIWTKKTLKVTCSIADNGGGSQDCYMEFKDGSNTVPQKDITSIEYCFSDSDCEPIEDNVFNVQEFKACTKFYVYIQKEKFLATR